MLKSCHHAFDGGILRVVKGWGLRNGWMGGRKERVRGEYRFEFARGGEGEGKWGVKGLSSRAEVREKVTGEYGFLKLMK